MASDEVRCRACGNPVTPGAPGVLTAFEKVHGQDFGGEPADVVEDGLPVYFHDGCRAAGEHHYRFV